MDLSAHGSPTLLNCNVEACVRYVFSFAFLLDFWEWEIRYRDSQTQGVYALPYRN